MKTINIHQSHNLNGTKNWQWLPLFNTFSSEQYGLIINKATLEKQAVIVPSLMLERTGLRI